MPGTYSADSLTVSSGVVQKLQFAGDSSTLQSYLTAQAIQQIYNEANYNLDVKLAQAASEYNASLAKVSNTIQNLPGVTNPLTATGNIIRSSVASATSSVNEWAIGTGYSSLAATTGFLGSLTQSAAGMAASIIDVPGTVSGIVNDVGTSIDYGEKYGWSVGVGRQIGISQLGEIIAGSDISAGESVNYWDKASEAAGRLGSTAGLGTGGRKIADAYSNDCYKRNRDLFLVWRNACENSRRDLGKLKEQHNS